MPRARGIQIYLKEGIEEDDVLLALWEICKTQARPQEVFRRMLQKGLKEMIKQKDLSDSVINELTERLNSEDFKIISEAPPVSETPLPSSIKKPKSEPKIPSSPVDEVIAQKTTPEKPKDTKKNFNHEQGLISKNLM